MKNAFIICVFSFSGVYSNAQSIQPSVINSGGNSYHTNKYSFEWSIGEMPVVEPMKESGSFWITNGFLQPQTRGNTNHRGTDFLPGSIVIAPVPATTYIDINFFIREKGRLQIQVSDVLGKIVYQGSRWHLGLDATERLMISHLAKGTYLVTFEMPGAFGYPVKKGTYEFIKL